MGESIRHIQLVYSIIELIEKIIEESYKVLVLKDLPESKDKPPQTAEGFRPDVYYCYEGLLIVGEAKTSCDYNTKHSLQQYYSYLKMCTYYEGRSMLVLAIPWTEYISLKNMIRRLKKKYEFDVEVIILNDLGRVERV